MSKIQNQALRIGTQISVYEIKECIGSNHSEIIYRACNKRLNSTVILKEFFPFEYVSRGENNQVVLLDSMVSEFVFEFGLGNFIQFNEKLLEIQHHGAQTAHNILELNQTAYFAVDDPEGKLLSEYLSDSGVYTEGELKKFLSSLLDTLDEFHSANIVHGDIHPDNILINKDGKPVLVNFASARQKFARYIEAPTLALHAGYASPEQYLTSVEIEASADLYALGAVLYRCIFGVDPENAEIRMSELKSDNPDPLKSVLDKPDSDFSGEFLVTVDWMLQPASKARPQSVNEVMPSLREAKSSPENTTGFTSKIKYFFGGQATELDSKTKSFGVVALAVSIFASVTLGSWVTSWFLGSDEVRDDSIVLRKPAKQEKIAFGKAVDSVSEKITMNSSILGGSEKNAGLINLSPEKALQLINENMVKAEESFSKFYLTTPAEGNAYSYYTKVLEIDPDHEGAKKGIEKIFNQYILLINKAIGAGDKPLAKLYLNRIKAVTPDTSPQKKTIDSLEGVLQG